MSALLYAQAQRFVGEVREIPGANHHSPFIQWCFECCGYGPETPDEVPWCSAFVNRIAWMLRKPRSKSAAARSWLTVGVPVPLHEAELGDVVILKRGGGEQPGPEVTKGAPGHVGFFAGQNMTAGKVLILGGNQSDGVTVASFPSELILGIRRI